VNTIETLNSPQRRGIRRRETYPQIPQPPLYHHKLASNQELATYLPDKKFSLSHILSDLPIYHSKMTSTNPNHGPLSDSHEEQTMTLPFTQKLASTNITESSSPQDHTAPEKSWKPTFDRRQSWSNQDRKHQLQERLLGSEKGKEMGFTEAHSGD